jgi:hypothetical protein
MAIVSVTHYRQNPLDLKKKQCFRNWTSFCLQVRKGDRLCWVPYEEREFQAVETVQKPSGSEHYEAFSVCFFYCQNDVA